MRSGTIGAPPTPSVIGASKRIVTGGSRLNTTMRPVSSSTAKQVVAQAATGDSQTSQANRHHLTHALRRGRFQPGRNGQ